jgi:hypothetical protein
MNNIVKEAVLILEVTVNNSCDKMSHAADAIGASKEAHMLAVEAYIAVCNTMGNSIVSDGGNRVNMQKNTIERHNTRLLEASGILRQGWEIGGETWLNERPDQIFVVADS